MNLQEYYSADDWSELLQKSENLQTPCLVIDLKRIKKIT